MICNDARPATEEYGMPTRLNPYLTFAGDARAAMEFYRDVLGGELTLMTFAEAGAPDAPNADEVMHAMLETSSGFTLMASDTPPGMEVQEGSRISISLSGDDEPTLRGYWDGLLAAGGTAVLPLEKAPWGDWFGMVADRFGVTWMVNISGS